MRRARKSGDTKKPRSNNLSQFGLFDIPTANKFEEDDFDDDDDDLEAELNMIMTSSAPVRPSRPPPRLKPAVDLDSMVAASLKDEPSDEDDSGDDDPDLLEELKLVTGVDRPPPTETTTQLTSSDSIGSVQPASQANVIILLKERITMYEQAEIIANQTNNPSKARRLKRGLDQLKTLLRKAESGGTVNEDEIPLPTVVSSKESAGSLEPLKPAEDSSDRRSPVASSEGKPAEAPVANQETISMLTARRDEYKRAAVLAKRSGDTQTALAHIKVIKQFEAVIAAVEKGETVDLQTMPPPPGQISRPSEPPPVPPRAAPPQPPPVAGTEQQSEQSSEPVTVLSALESRLAKFREQEEAAQREGNSSKVRRMGRIIKQYQDALRLHKLGKPIPVDELPTPPGFPPIPVETGEGGKPNEGDKTGVVNVPEIPSVEPGEDKSVEEGTEVPASPVHPPPKSAPSPTKAPTAPSPQGSVSRHDRQLATLLSKQKQYKEAAIKAKQSGDMVKAKEYLRLAKGFDTVIEASRSGLPVDMDTLPRPPGKSSSLDSFEVVKITDCLPGSDSEIFEKLLKDLQSQFKMCIETRNHFKAMGDVANANRFEHMASNTKKDLDTVRGAHIKNDPIPRFHYEERTFSIVRCNVDLTDNDLELSIIQGVNYNVPNPKEIDTYVRFEFPYPNDEAKRDKTGTIYNTNNPEYNTVFTIPIQRSSRAFLRIFKRHSIKMEIWSKGGFLRSDSLVATVQVKLQPLETKCTIHDAFDLMDGRKPLGGKLEVKVRVRNPMVSKQIEQVKEKWLLIS